MRNFYRSLLASLLVLVMFLPTAQADYGDIGFTDAPMLVDIDAYRASEPVLPDLASAICPMSIRNWYACNGSSGGVIAEPASYRQAAYVYRSGVWLLMRPG